MYLCQVPLETWSFAHSTSRRYQHFTSNVAESVNSQLVEARKLSYLRLFYAIVEKSITDRDKKIRGFTTVEFTEHALKILKKRIKSGRKFAAQVVREGDNTATVRNVLKASEFVDRKVDLAAKKCSCKVFQDSGMPCEHACAFLGKLKINPETQIDNVYSQSRYKDSFSIPIVQKPLTELIPPFEVLAPKFERRIGRPRRKRMRSRGEISNNGTRQVTCSSCLEKGHNRTTCPSRTTSN